MSKRIVQIQSSSISLGQMLCGVKKTNVNVDKQQKLIIYRIQRQLSRANSNPVLFKR